MRGAEGRKLRHELKYLVQQPHVVGVASRLKHALKRDPNGDANGEYRIRSLYFDDLSDAGLFERQAGLDRRKKWRIRIYDLKDDVVVLERKHRLGEFISKDRVRIDRGQADLLIAGDSAWTWDHPSELLRTFGLLVRQRSMRPAVIVDYVREAWVSPYGNVRITLDKHLSTAMASHALFDQRQCTVGVIPGETVLEVKYDHFFPGYLSGLLMTSIPPRSAVSKYVLCRTILKNNAWEDQ